MKMYYLPEDIKFSSNNKEQLINNLVDNIRECEVIFPVKQEVNMALESNNAIRHLIQALADIRKIAVSQLHNHSRSYRKLDKENKQTVIEFLVVNEIADYDGIYLTKVQS